MVLKNGRHIVMYNYVVGGYKYMVLKNGRHIVMYNYVAGGYKYMAAKNGRHIVNVELHGDQLGLNIF